MSGLAWELVCVECQQSYAGDAFRYRCDCGDLDVQHAVTQSVSLSLFDQRLGSKCASTVPESGGFANWFCPSRNASSVPEARAIRRCTGPIALLNMQGSCSSV